MKKTRKINLPDVYLGFFWQSLLQLINLNFQPVFLIRKRFIFLLEFADSPSNSFILPVYNFSLVSQGIQFTTHSLIICTLNVQQTFQSRQFIRKNPFCKNARHTSTNSQNLNQCHDAPPPNTGEITFA